MANIAISNLRAPGAELFMDSESYLQELTDTELDVTKGGTSPLIVTFAAGVVLGIGAGIGIGALITAHGGGGGGGGGIRNLI